MGKKLAIRGDATRGKEVIELLEMLGGESNGNMKGYNDDLYYYIAKDGLIYGSGVEYEELACNYTLFTLEEFLEKYPYKIGDKVIDLKSGKIAEVYKIHWSENNSRVYYDIKYPNNHGCQRTVMELKPYKETNMKDNKTFIEDDKTNIDYDAIFSFNHTMRPEVNADGMLCYKIPDGYESFSVQEGMIILKPKKPTYPKTYEECCDKIKFKGGFREILLSDDEHLLCLSFIKLKRCRDAYWKIAGEEMGLGKPWEPDWTSGKPCYCITTCENKIGKGRWYTDNKILAFPTEEMQDTFYDNFKDLIEQCKELL